MPFINGRYYVNPVMGQALEAAREAEAALAELENRARQNSGSDGDGADGRDDADFSVRSHRRSVAARANSDEPIHRVEIEAAELVPAHSGHAARGYVARVHRRNPAGADGMLDNDPTAGSHATGAGGATHAETHVFADHRDLLSFLRDELAKDSRAGEPRRHSA